MFFNVNFIDKQYIKAKQFHFKFSFCFKLIDKTKVKKNVGNWLLEITYSDVFNQTR